LFWKKQEGEVCFLSGEAFGSSASMLFHIRRERALKYCWANGIKILLTVKYGI
jgi:hypothetical protein